MLLSEQAIKERLSTVLEPNSGLDLITAGIIQRIVLVNHTLNLSVKLNYLWAQAEDALRQLITPSLHAIWPDLEVKFTIQQSVHRHLAANGVKSVPEIKNIIAVASGKGGVGKSTVAVNLALALHLNGAKVGLLDADIYGPSQPHMLGVTTKPVINDSKSIEPIIIHGIQTMSIGYLINPDTPAVWRGPMVSGALQQMLNSTAWQDLDYLIVDLPPGTGDVQLTLAQKIPVCGAVIVTTPQDVALIDVTKAISMFTRVKVPVLGVVENMSLHVCTNCGHAEHIFGNAGGQTLATQHAVRLLASLPLELQIREQGDAGLPIVLAQPTANSSLEFLALAKKVAAELAKTPRNLSVPVHQIVIEEL